MRHQDVALAVQQAYESTSLDFAQWSWVNHVPVVARHAEKLSLQYHANIELAVAGAWLHDVGDGYVDRFAENHEAVTRLEATKIMQQCGYSVTEIDTVLNQVIKPHSCRENNLPSTIEGKVLATTDALAHLTTDFYVQLCWKHLPEGKSYPEFIEWVNEKLDRDYHKKIFFSEQSHTVTARYEVLKAALRVSS